MDGDRKGRPLPTATGNAVLRAYNSAVKHLQKDPGIAATESSAGFIIPIDQKRGSRTGFQGFVKIFRFSETSLRLEPETGGLICNRRR